MHSSRSKDLVEDKEIFRLAVDNRGSVPLNLFASAKERIDCHIDEPSSRQPFVRALIKYLPELQKRKDLRVRVITSISSENMQVCKQLVKDLVLYHADGIVGNFAVVDGTAYASYVEEPGQERGRFLLSSHAPFVKMQQHLFENLLARSITAKEKLRDIERGVQPEYIETIRDPSSMLQVARELASSASFEILVLFSTINSFYRAESDGMLDLLGEASSRGVNVRVLIKIEDETVKDSSKQKIKQKHDRINVNFIRQSLKSKITTLVADQTFSLAIEVNDDAKKNFSEATGLATYSNSDSTVFTYYSMFENLWIQAELERQNSVKHAYFQMFKGQKLRDENYERDWSLKDSG